MPNYTPLINGQAYAYADIVVNILGTPIAGITAVSYNDAQEITENFGAGSYPVSRGFGKIESTATITIERGELNALLNAAPNKRLQDIPEFDMIVSYVPSSSTPVTDVVRNCRIKNTVGGATLDDSNVMAELELAVSHIDWNN